METTGTVIAVFSDHNAAETAMKKLTAAGFEMKNLSVVGKGYHSEEKVVGFSSAGDRIRFWGGREAFWGGLSEAFSLAGCSWPFPSWAMSSSSDIWPSRRSPPPSESAITVGGPR
jgi:hypothetical protein